METESPRVFTDADFAENNEFDDISRKRKNLSFDSNEEIEEPLTKKPRRVQLRGNKTSLIRLRTRSFMPKFKLFTCTCQLFFHVSFYRSAHRDAKKRLHHE